MTTTCREQSQGNRGDIIATARSRDMPVVQIESTPQARLEERKHAHLSKLRTEGRKGESCFQPVRPYPVKKSCGTNGVWYPVKKGCGTRVQKEMVHSSHIFIKNLQRCRNSNRPPTQRKAQNTHPIMKGKEAHQCNDLCCEGHAPPTSHVTTIPRRGNHLHGSGNGEYTGDMPQPSVRKELDDTISWGTCISQARVLEGLIALLLC